MKLTLLISILTISVAAGQTQDSVKVTIENIKSVNSSFADYGAVTTADGMLMMFTSRRPFTPKQIKSNVEVTESVFSSVHDNNLHQWTPPMRLSEVINIPGKNNSVIALSNDGQQLLLYRDAQNGNGDIYVSHLKGSEWTNAESLGAEVNSEFHESSASLSPDGRTLYFVSDRPGGVGGRDIWLSRKGIDGKWSTVQNLGSTVNSPLDEEAVFIHPDGKTLYFSSKGFNSLAGYVGQVKRTSIRSPLHLFKKQLQVRSLFY
jgi:hypothetical protein